MDESEDFRLPRIARLLSQAFVAEESGVWLSKEKEKLGVLFFTAEMVVVVAPCVVAFGR